MSDYDEETSCRVTSVGDFLDIYGILGYIPYHPYNNNMLVWWRIGLPLVL